LEHGFIQQLHVEDATSKISFVSQRVTYPLIRNSVYRFNSAYVHEFEDKSLLLIITEHTKIEPKKKIRKGCLSVLITLWVLAI